VPEPEPTPGSDDKNAEATKNRAEERPKESKAEDEKADDENEV